MGEPEWNRQPDRLYAPQRYILAMGGKRLRPILALMGAESVGAKAELALPAAHAVERFHNFSLIHDDIMDAAPLRRGQATVHERWGLNTAILSGDALFVLAYKALESAPKSAQPDLYRVFTRTALEVCEGQQWDMDFEHEDQVEEGAYLRMIRYKTSVLLGCALEMGCFERRRFDRTGQGSVLVWTRVGHLLSDSRRLARRLWGSAKNGQAGRRRFNSGQKDPALD